MLTVDITSRAPDGYRTLLWDIFFASRGRGISIERHFPWLSGERSYFVTLREGSEVISGLAVNPVERGERVAGLVGLMCVRSDRRGQGHSRTALMAAISHAGRLGTDDLVLWTNTPGIYSKLGFEPHDGSSYGWATGVPAAVGEAPLKSAFAEPGRGLPPFVREGHRWTTTAASAVVLVDAIGPILAEWSGSDNDVAALLGHVMPERWRLNCLKGDSLPNSLRNSWALDMQPSNLQMIKPLRRNTVADPYGFRLLDRV